MVFRSYTIFQGSVQVSPHRIMSSLFFECVPKYRRMMVPLHSLGKRQAAAEIMEEDSAVAGSGHNLKSIGQNSLHKPTVWGISTRTLVGWTLICTENDIRSVPRFCQKFFFDSCTGRWAIPAILQLLCSHARNTILRGTSKKINRTLWTDLTPLAAGCMLHALSCPTTQPILPNSHLPHLPKLFK